MQIDTGLFDHMVLQRNQRGVSDARITGRAASDGAVEARVTRGAKTFSDWKKIGDARRGKLDATLKGLPTGGPYEVVLRVRASKTRDAGETLTVRDVLVGDVWILAGQSNMQGCGVRRWAAKPHPMTRAFFTDDRWAVARDPLHNLWDCVDQVHIDLSGGVRGSPDTARGVGPGVAFGQEMHRLSGGVPQGLIACAHGGTSMAQWNPALKNKGGGSLYGATLRRVRKNGGRITGIAWYQGESEANPDAARIYTAEMKKLVASMRRDFGNAALPFVAVQIARVLAPWTANAPWNSIQEQQRLLPRAIKRCAIVPAIDLALDDLIHIGTADMNRLGKRLANAMHALTSGKGALPIELKGFTVIANPDNTGTADVVVEFANVAGKLTAPGGAACGFEVVDGQGAPHVYRTELDGSRAILHTTVTAADIGTRLLHYGYGTNPVCNVTDGADRSLPVFGPHVAGGARALTPFVRAYEISAFQPGAGKLEKLAYPADGGTLDFKGRAFPQPFASLRPEIAQRGEMDGLVYYRLALECAGAMRLYALFGYDGPVKVWLDGAEIYADPEGINPALTDAHSVPFRVGTGRHEFLVALGTNGGRAWGIFLRFERLDVSKRLIRLGPTGYAMPEV